ncbi:hypothetical protein DL767_001423 [Monosporascus sp. MG133]|nr:hypothetical protein DL767_001423 [Monosporascus sp. MG133]
MLRDPQVLDFDVLAVQEQWRNPFQATTHHPAKAQFHLCYPGDNENGPARVCLFINKRLNHVRWQFKEHTRDLCQTTLNSQSVLPLLRQILAEYSHEEQIVRGDFNLHHELWGGINVRGAEQEADDLIELMEDYGLTNTLLPGTVAYEAGAPTKAKDGNSARRKAVKAEEKAQLLREAFFPTPPDANLEDINNVTYTDQIPIPPITTQKVENAILATPSLKAPGQDGIPNLILQIALPYIKMHLTRIFN